MGKLLLIVLICTFTAGVAVGTYFGNTQMNVSAGTCVNSFTNFVGDLFQK